MSRPIDILKPNFKLLPVRERVLCALGALFGLAISSAFSWWTLGGFNAWYIAPMGASSVLLFAVPSSPLAQPWNLVVGNTLAALIGVLCAQYIPEATLAFSLAVALAIFVMMSSDSLHPPSGAVAMTAVLGGASVHQLGFKFIAYPVLLNSLLLLAVAIIFNRAIGRSYPNTAQLNTRSKDPTPEQKVSIQPQDIQDVLAHQTELLDISQYRLEEIILQAQRHAQQRSPQIYTCQDIMSRDLITLNAQDEIQQAVEKFKQVNLMSLPVVDEAGKLLGTLALYEVVEWFQSVADPRAPHQDFVYQIMQRQVVTVQPEQPLYDLIPYFVERSFNYIAVVEQQRLVGIISRADMIAALQRQLLMQQA